MKNAKHLHRISTVLTQKIANLVGFFFENRCYQCGITLEYHGWGLCTTCFGDQPSIHSESRCPRCLAQLESSDIHTCTVCNNTGFILERLYSFYPYTTLWQQIILDVKNQGRKRLWEYIVTQAIEWQQNVLDEYMLLRPDYIAAIPLHTHKYKQRGFNQAEILADILAAQFHIPKWNGLIRVQRGFDQKTLSEKERRKSIYGKFKISDVAAPLHGKTIWIIDDVATTGATLNEAARVIQQLKPCSISGLTFVRV